VDQWIFSLSEQHQQHQHQSRAAPAPEQSSTSTAPAQLMGKCSKCQEKPASYCDPADGLGRYCKQYASTVSKHGVTLALAQKRKLYEVLVAYAEE
jgi:hypothetical protein